jgi:hypothetical protein
VAKAITMPTKAALIKKIETIQSKMQSLWADLGTDNGLHCQTITRELAELEKAIERGEIKPRK